MTLRPVSATALALIMGLGLMANSVQAGNLQFAEQAVRERNERQQAARPQPQQRPQPTRPQTQERPRPQRPQGQQRPDRGRPDMGRPDRNRPDRPQGQRPDRNDNRDRNQWQNRPSQGGGNWQNNRPDRRDNDRRDNDRRDNDRWNDRRDNDRWNNNRPNRPDYRPDRPNVRPHYNRPDRVNWYSRHNYNYRNHHDFRSYTGIRVGFYFAPRYGYYRVPTEYYGYRYDYGDYLPRYFYSYRVFDPYFYNLPSRPFGTEYYFVGNDIVLVQTATGLIIDIFYDVF